MVVVAALMNMGMGTARVGGPPLMYSVIARKGAGAGVEATTEAEGVVRTNRGGRGLWIQRDGEVGVSPPRLGSCFRETFRRGRDGRWGRVFWGLGCRKGAPGGL